MRYRKIIKQLRQTKKHTIEYVTATAKQILNCTGYYEDLAVPIICILGDFGIEVYETDNFPDTTSGIIYAGGTTADIYNF